jgi:hypothetical protein
MSIRIRRAGTGWAGVGELHSAHPRGRTGPPPAANCSRPSPCSRVRAADAAACAPVGLAKCHRGAGGIGLVKWGRGTRSWSQCPYCPHHPPSQNGPPHLLANLGPKDTSGLDIRPVNLAVSERGAFAATCPSAGLRSHNPLSMCGVSGAASRLKS